MTALAVIGIILAVLFFILSLKATVKIEYCGEVSLSVRVLLFNIKILPSKKDKRRPQSMSAKKAAKLKAKLEAKEKKKRTKKAQKKKEKEEKKQALASGTAKKEKKSPSEILDIVELVLKLVQAVISKFFGHLKIKLARLRLVLGSEDAATTAILYGAVTQSINVLFPLLEGVKNFSVARNADIDVAADFTSEETQIDICIAFSLRVWHLFHIAFAALGKLIKYFFKSLKRKEAKNNQ